MDPLINALLGIQPAAAQDSSRNALSGPAQEPEYLTPGMGMHLRAFGAGLADPMGAPSWALNKWTQNLPAMSPVSPSTAEWYEKLMADARAESPIAAGAGSALIPGMGGLKLAHTTGRELMRGIPILMTMGGYAGGLIDDYTKSFEKFRASQSPGSDVPVLPGAPY